MGGGILHELGAPMNSILVAECMTTSPCSSPVCLSSCLLFSPVGGGVGESSGGGSADS